MSSPCRSAKSVASTLGDRQDWGYHRNEGTPILNPFPATEAVLREQENAAALIAQARRLQAGEPALMVAVGFHREDR